MVIGDSLNAVRSSLDGSGNDVTGHLGDIPQAMGGRLSALLQVFLGLFLHQRTFREAKRGYERSDSRVTVVEP